MESIACVGAPARKDAHHFPPVLRARADVADGTGLFDRGLRGAFNQRAVDLPSAQAALPLLRADGRRRHGSSTILTSEPSVKVTATPTVASSIALRRPCLM